MRSPAMPSGSRLVASRDRDGQARSSASTSAAAAGAGHGQEAGALKQPDAVREFLGAADERADWGRDTPGQGPDVRHAMGDHRRDTSPLSTPPIPTTTANGLT